MRIAGSIRHSLVNGDGIRFVLFVQGCHHHCPKCQNQETWDPKGGMEKSIESIADEIKHTKCLDGITLSGGDPYYQEEECCRLLDLLPDMNVWVYTGFEWSDIKNRPLTQQINVAVTGPYVDELKCTGHMYGSSNQEIHYIRGDDDG